jgi:predicted O-linked N-acetylglucosamine transferase (SPINDLY family)
MRRSEARAGNVERLLREAEQAHRAQRLTEAQALFQRVIDVEPSQPYAWRGLAMLAWQTGAIEKAITLLARAVECAPREAVLRWQYGCALQQRERCAEAAEEFKAACRLRPDVAQHWEDLGVVLQALGETRDAAHAYRRASELEPSLSRRLKQATLVSPIPASREAIVEERARLDAEMDALLAAPGDGDQDPTRMALWSNFHWAYHGECNRALQTKAAAVYHHLFPSLDYVAAHCRASERTKGRIRVGLISQYFCNHSIGRTSRGLFAQLARDKFEVTALFVAPTMDDHFSRFIREHAEHSVEVPRALPAAREIIEARHFDVLFYQDIGMDPFTYFLAFSRLAPIQCVSFGHPDTTGIPTMDYFISNDLYESADAQADYSERLFLLRDLGTLAYYYRPARAKPGKSRSHFGLADDAHLYVCPQNLFKIHPDMDEILAGILRRDPRGRIVMIHGRIGHWTQLLERRWASSMPDVMDRIVFLPRMDSEDFVELIAMSDVMLDTLHFNGMNTSLDALAVGTPVVTCPGTLQRGRHTQAMYRKMNLTGCIAGDARSYIDRAVRLGVDASNRAALRAEILQRNAVLFEDIGVVREFERFFEESVREKAGKVA